MPDNPNTAEPQKPRRRWFQFRLRTLLIVVPIYGASAAAFHAWSPSQYFGAPMFFLGCGLLGAATGALIGRPIFGILVGLIAGAVAFWLVPGLVWIPRAFPRAIRPATHISPTTHPLDRLTSHPVALLESRLLLRRRFRLLTALC